jgi:hypothetical protein
MAAAISWRANVGVIFFMKRRSQLARMNRLDKKISPESIFLLPFNLLTLAALAVPVDINPIRIVDRRVHVDIVCGLRGLLMQMLFPIETRCRNAGSGKRNEDRDLCPTTGQILFAACARDAKRPAPAKFMPGLGGRHAAWHGFRSVRGIRPSVVPNWSRAVLGQGSRVS